MNKKWKIVNNKRKKEVKRKMKLSWIKLENDHQNFKVAEKLGMHVEHLQFPEQVDKKLEELVKQNYDTIMISNELASFSEDIVKKYQKENRVKIIISPR